MLDQLPGWLQVAIGVASFILLLVRSKPPRRSKRNRVRITSLEIGKMKWTRFDASSDS